MSDAYRKAPFVDLGAQVERGVAVISFANSSHAKKVEFTCMATWNEQETDKKIQKATSGKCFQVRKRPLQAVQTFDRGELNGQTIYVSLES